MPCVARGAVAGGRRGEQGGHASGKRLASCRQALQTYCRRAVVWRGRACSGWGPRHLVWVQVEEAGGDHRRSLVFWVVSKQSGLTVPTNGSVGKKTGGDTTTRTEIETAGSGKDLGFWLWPLGAGRCKAAPYAIEGPHPSPAASSATVEEPRARTESRCASEK